MVAGGETLSDIAYRYYGNTRPATLRRIRDANRRVLHDDRITAGDVLRLPSAGLRAATGGRG